MFAVDQAGSPVSNGGGCVQHADRDPQLQATVLPMFIKRYEAGELSGDDVAKLADRILVAQGKPQRFGISSIGCLVDSSAIPRPRWRRWTLIARTSG